MSTLYKQLKTAADQLEKLASDIEAAEAATKAAKAEAAQAKTAAATHQKTAAAQTAKLGTLAKTAADKLLASGLISNEQKRDQFAAEVMTHEAALERLAKLAQFVTVPKTASVVVDNTAATSTADSAWERQVAAVNAKLNLR